MFVPDYELYENEDLNQIPYTLSLKWTLSTYLRLNVSDPGFFGP